MNDTAWIAFAALLFTILTVSGGGLAALFTKLETLKSLLTEEIDNHRKELDEELDRIRKAADAEAKDLRRELHDGFSKAYLEFGEAPKALREKVTQVELFMRDTYLPIQRFEREQDQILKVLEALKTQIEMKFESFGKKLDTALLPGIKTNHLPKDHP